ncbi:MAG: SURF1 family protein [Caldilineaceae bacterium]|nr:SURF1 family protein [Caldilineaceae bacterium]
MSEVLSVFKTMFNRRWWWKTLIVIAAMIFMAGLGNWQLQRLDQRRAYNAELLAKLASDPIVVDGGPLPEEPADLVDRRATVSGTYDFAGQISIKNQSHMGQPGVHLVTPFHIDGSDHAILINRGWVPYQQGTSALWGQFDEAAQATLSGYLQKSQKMPDGSTTAVNETPQEAWFRLDIEAIQTQIDAPLMPVYLDLAPEEGRLSTALPVRIQPETDISEGNHMSYAIQWYSFALIAGIVYFGVVRRQERERLNPSPTVDTEDTNTENPVAL